MLFLMQECTKADLGISLKPGPVLSLLFLKAWKEFGLKTWIVVWPWNLYIWEINLLHMSSTHVWEERRSIRSRAWKQTWRSRRELGHTPMSRNVYFSVNLFICVLRRRTSAWDIFSLIRFPNIWTRKTIYQPGPRSRGLRGGINFLLQDALHWPQPLTNPSWTMARRPGVTVVNLTSGNEFIQPDRFLYGTVIANGL